MQLNTWWTLSTEPTLQLKLLPSEPSQRESGRSDRACLHLMPCTEAILGTDCSEVKTGWKTGWQLWRDISPISCFFCREIKRMWRFTWNLVGMWILSRQWLWAGQIVTRIYTSSGHVVSGLSHYKWWIAVSFAVLFLNLHTGILCLTFCVLCKFHGNGSYYGKPRCGCPRRQATRRI